ncbi:unnamed protein product [Ilex paraguariensis]|uniref:K Homology domain-containing protein n=1 Tax=Ilex paraguariensis TaxID=185542 RepID=A0ABC8RZ64_9AQUA
MAPFRASSMGWHGAPAIATTPNMKRIIRLDVPVEKFPNYNFVGRILGPRGNSLKRVEAMTECRIYIRGRGSVKDSVKVMPRVVLAHLLADGDMHLPLQTYSFHNLLVVEVYSLGLNERFDIRCAMKEILAFLIHSSVGRNYLCSGCYSITDFD